MKGMSEEKRKSGDPQTVLLSHNHRIEVGYISVINLYSEIDIHKSTYVNYYA